MNAHQRRAALRAEAARHHVTATPSARGGWMARHNGMPLGDGHPSRTAALRWGLTWGLIFVPFVSHAPGVLTVCPAPPRKAP